MRRLETRSFRVGPLDDLGALRLAGDRFAGPTERTDLGAGVLARVRGRRSVRWN